MPLWCHDKWQGGWSNEILCVLRDHIWGRAQPHWPLGESQWNIWVRVSAGAGSVRASRIRKISLKQWLWWQMCAASDKDQIFILAEIKSFLSPNLLWILQRIYPRIYVADQPTHWARTVLCHCCGWKAAEGWLKVSSLSLSRSPSRIN